MSIYDVISSKLNSGELFAIPSNLGFPRERQVMLVPNVRDFVFGPHLDEKVRSRRLRLEVELMWLVEGGEVRVSLPGADPYADVPDADLRLLHPGSDEVWEIRSKMQPQIRILGSFARPDLFVGLLWAYRKDLGEPPWKQCEHSKLNWGKLFPGYQPHTGKTVHDYVTKNVISL